MKRIMTNVVPNVRRRYMTAVGASVALWLFLLPLHAAALDRSTPGCTLVLTPSGALDGRAYNAPIAEVMRELARVTGAEVVGVSSADTTRTSFAFDNVSVAEALARILRKRNYTVLLRPSSGRQQVARVTVLGATSQAAPAVLDIPPHDWAPVEPVASAPGMADFHSRSADERFTPGNDAMDRLSALEELNDSGVLNVDALFEISEVDPDQEIRTRATEMLEADSSTNRQTAERLRALTAEADARGARASR